MHPQTLLSLLVGAAVAAGGILQGLQWKNAAAAAADNDLQGQIIALGNEVDMLKRENESLRSLAQGGGEIKVPNELIGFVENAFGFEFRSSPVVHQIAGEELRDRVTASIESRYPPNSLDHRQQAWALMGLLTPDDRFAPQLSAMRSLGARSWFDDQTGEGWVTDRFDEASVPDQSALVRILGRILIHQNYPPTPGYPGDEAANAREALHHGAAMAVENRFLARQAVGIGFTGVQADSGARDLLESLPIFVKGIATFPSLLGTPRAERLMDQEELLFHLHKSPHRTSWFFPDSEDLEVAAIDLPESPHELVIDESAGMLGFQLWLQTLDPELTPLARAWRGDRYQLTAQNDVALDLVWDIRMADEEKAKELLELGLAMAGALAQTESDPKPGESVSSPEGRRISVSQPSPELVRFSNLSPE
ncbi:hypothetical protein ACFQY0_13705 [Haloferula chungangensis]|uniref:Uncharacterized protein n=1 Tax=Haloferula chungangensis TaxID=1048331 RepID=A0ABW2L923_9BACT